MAPQTDSQLSYLSLPGSTAVMRSWEVQLPNLVYRWVGWWSASARSVF
jgi:hypothetical protein